MRGTPDKTVTANEKFKDSFGTWFWGSVVAAVLVHFLAFALWPEMGYADMSIDAESLEAIELPPEIEIPPPPQQIARPATPIIGAADISEDITIAETTFESVPINNLPPPPTATASEDISKAPVFTPFTQAPRLTNAADVARTLERTYPPLLRDAGIGGEVIMWFFIDEAGRVLKTELNKSSGYPALDEAAGKVADMMRYSPAYNRDKKVQVWVQIPIKFSTK
ncbi:MAG: energy transducer TonB [Gemmatimonadetes bacterium]|nr:energy transducer TonB [Gemmatimonadota bacterium]